MLANRSQSEDCAFTWLVSKTVDAGLCVLILAISAMHACSFFFRVIARLSEYQLGSKFVFQSVHIQVTDIVRFMHLASLPQSLPTH